MAVSVFPQAYSHQNHEILRLTQLQQILICKLIIATINFSFTFSSGHVFEIHIDALE